jgi:hypothetical protein
LDWKKELDGASDYGRKEKETAVACRCAGVIAALGIDQHSALRKLFAKALSVEAETVPAEKLVEFKEAVSRILTPPASATLLYLETEGLAQVSQSGSPLSFSLSTSGVRNPPAIGIAPSEIRPRKCVNTRLP